MKKAVIYARFSCGRQTEQSIEGQLRKCHAYAKEHDIVVVNEYVDRARTARNDNRPFFQKMLSDSENSEWDYVIVYAIDRFSRDDGDYGADKRILRNNGVTLLSATETIGMNADGTENLGGILTEGLLVALAKYYSRELSQKIRRGQYESIQKGNYLGGSIVYGYKVVDKKICVEPEQAEVVRMIFELYSKGNSAFDIADILKEKGLNNSKGQPFKPNGIMKMLKNTKYIGTYAFGDQVVEDYHQAIVDKNLFFLVQERIDKNKMSPARLKARDEFILSGKLFCGYCKHAMIGESGTSHTGQSHYYYKCGHRKRGGDCNKKTIKKDVLEDIVIRETLKQILNGSVINDIVTEILAIQESQRDISELTLLRKELEKVNSYIKNILSAIKRGIITDSTQEELQSLEEEKKALEAKVAQEEYKDSQRLTREHIEFWFEQFLHFDETDKGAREYLVNYFIRKVILYDDKVIIIYNHDGDTNTDLSDEDIEALGSDLTHDRPPKAHNPNLIITRNFVALVIGL